MTDLGILPDANDNLIRDLDDFAKEFEGAMSNADTNMAVDEKDMY